MYHDISRATDLHVRKSRIPHYGADRCGGIGRLPLRDGWPTQRYIDCVAFLNGVFAVSEAAPRRRAETLRILVGLDRNMTSFVWEPIYLGWQAG